MHDGWLGKDHEIFIKIDKKFTDDVIKKLGHKKLKGLPPPEDYSQEFGPYSNEVFGHGTAAQKLVYKHEIIITIK